MASSATYNTFIEELTSIMKARGLGNLDPHDFGTPLWAMVYGFASLLIGKPANLDNSSQALRGRKADAT
ncbi:hypothetical protein [Leisingera sp. M523]|uniref:hypothetical protein n=1 Tax=Leisingera sp. M523 TaxID=2867013 RepID=UPI0021A7A9CB|nr:hypothetical protein [Leisingera sp. M523]UWQ28518.1 hypothetical protein K3557_17425 [Leisingera sp. M523]